jgi:Tol biopolymer transport system component/DNA-binding winged helix-turn-helix (wHTH) protein
MFELLVMLVKNHGRIVTKEELFANVWPDSYVEEGNITYNIRQLRKALGDDFQEPLFIETVPRLGYRFIARVTEISDIPAEAVEGSPTTGQSKTIYSRPARRVILVSAVVFAFLLGAISFSVWILSSKTARAAPILTAPFSLEKLSTDGSVVLSAISRDGKTVVYSRRSAGRQSIWLRQLDTPSNTEIVPASDFVYFGLAFSPDGKYIYLVRGPTSSQSGQADVFRVPIFGGIPQRVVSETQGWISLSPQGEKISFVRCPRDDQEYCSLWIADSADGKNERKLVSRPYPIRIADNKISPDGKSVAFAFGESRTASNDFGLAQVDIESGVERELTAEKFFNISYLVWLPDQKGLLFTARKQSEKNFGIWQLSTSTGETSLLTADSQSYSNLSLSGDGSILASSQVEPDFRLNVYQMDHPEAGPKTLVNATTVGFAPSGKILFSSIKTGYGEIWSINPDGTDERQLTSDPPDDISPIASPDNVIFFASNRSGSLQIWRMNQDGSNQTQITSGEGGYPLLVSSDRQWLYYKSAIQKTIRRISLQNGREESVFDRSGGDSALSPDGNLVAYTERKNDENVLTVISVADGSVLKTFRYASPKSRPERLLWSHDGKYLAYILADEVQNKQALWFQPIDNEKPKKVADLLKDEVFELTGFALSSDDKTLAVIQGDWNHNAVLIRGLK